MKHLFFVFLITNSALASGIYCNGDVGNLHLNLDHGKREFNFAQFCWNPCNMGYGEITSGPRRGWAGIFYALDLNNSDELISPMKTRKMTLLLDHSGLTGTLSDGTGVVNLKCREEKE